MPKGREDQYILGKKKPKVPMKKKK